jgi:hypothetical protein
MAFLAALFGLLILAMGVWGVISPSRLLASIARLQSQRGLYIIAAIRLALGSTLLLAAPASRAPLLLQIFGVLAIISGVITPFLGVELFGSIIGWWQRIPTLVTRLWCGVVILFGAALIWAAVL